MSHTPTARSVRNGNSPIAYREEALASLDELLVHGASQAVHAHHVLLLDGRPHIKFLCKRNSAPVKRVGIFSYLCVARSLKITVHGHVHNDILYTGQMYRLHQNCFGVDGQSLLQRIAINHKSTVQFMLRQAICDLVYSFRFLGLRGLATQKIAIRPLFLGVLRGLGARPIKTDLGFNELISLVDFRHPARFA